MTSRWNQADDVPRGASYAARWDELAAAGESIHGEADFVERYRPQTVLDAGCGTGRVAAELARRGIDVVGVDLDPGMLAHARDQSPGLEWLDGDVATISLDRTFDAVVMAGNVMIFVASGSESGVVANMARHVNPGGHLITGFQLGRGYAVDTYDEHAAAAGLERVARFSTWDGDAYRNGDDYAVSVHRRPDTADRVPGSNP